MMFILIVVLSMNLKKKQKIDFFLSFLFDIAKNVFILFSDSTRTKKVTCIEHKLFKPFDSCGCLAKGGCKTHSQVVFFRFSFWICHVKQ